MWITVVFSNLAATFVFDVVYFKLGLAKFSFAEHAKLAGHAPFTLIRTGFMHVWIHVIRHGHVSFAVKTISHGNGASET